MYVSGIHDLALKRTQKGRLYGKLARITNTQRSKRLLGFRAEAQSRTIVERYLEDEPYQMRRQEQGYTHSDMEEFDRIALQWRSYVATPGERETNTRTYNPIKEDTAP